MFAGLERGDANSRELLIVHNLRLVVYIAKKFESKTAGVEDLISIGHHRPYQGGEHLCAFKENKAGHLCQPVY